MADHPDTTNADHIASTSSILAALQKITASALKEAGYPDAALLISDWPELVGSKIGRAILHIRNKTQSGEEITHEDEALVEDALKEEHAKSAQLLGLLMSSAVGETLNASPRWDGA
jgi:hypothetical protein